MTVCAQCNGVGSCVGTTASDDLKDNEVSFQTPFNAPGSIPCSQCNGKGYQTTGSGA